MTLSDISTVFGMIVVTATGVAGGGKFYLDAQYIARDDPPPYNDVYVTLASQNLKLVYDTEDEMSRLQRKIDNGTATTADIARMATLKERLRNLQNE